MSKKESINSSIFYALKVSEISKVPFLFIGSAGTGKSTTVEMFAKIRGYELLLLRGSTASEQEIMGFMSVHQREDGVTATNVLPTWYTKMMEYHAEGKKTLLFLDEITAVNPYVQAALLHLIFERKVNEEKIPDDTLIVSAGNYSGNLTNEFELLSPVVNRFCVYNITPDENALDEFLNVYGDVSGKTDILEEKRKLLEKMDSQAVNIPEEIENKVAKYFETAIRETTRALMKSGEKPLDFGCTDTQSVYKAQDGDEILRGFISLRSLSYLTRVTLAVYRCFGPDGISGDNFKNILEGLVGIALSRKNGEVVSTKVATNYRQSIVQTLKNIQKLSNTKVKTYEEFFEKLTSGSKTHLDAQDITLTIDKLDEMSNDSELSGCPKIIEDEVMKSLCKLIENSVKKTTAFKKSGNIDAAKAISDYLTTETMTNMVSTFNQIVILYHKVYSASRCIGDCYPKDVLEAVDQTKTKIQKEQMKISSFYTISSKNDPNFKSLVPEIKPV